MLRQVPSGEVQAKGKLSFEISKIDFGQKDSFSLDTVFFGDPPLGEKCIFSLIGL